MDCDFATEYQAIEHDKCCTIIALKGAPVCTCAVKKGNFATRQRREAAQAARVAASSNSRPLRTGARADAEPSLRSYDGVRIDRVPTNELERYFAFRTPRLTSDLPRVRGTNLTNRTFIREWVAEAVKRTGNAGEVEHRLQLQEALINTIAAALMVEIASSPCTERKEQKLVTAVETWRAKQLKFVEFATWVSETMYNHDT